MGNIRAYDAAGRGLVIPVRIQPDYESEVTVAAEEYLGNGRYFIEFSVVGSPAIDRITIIAKDLRDDFLVYSVDEYNNGDRLTSYWNFSHSLSDLATFGPSAWLSGNDRLIGNRYDDVLRGFSGDDSLNGQSGNDRLFGMGGNDRIIGGIGRDRLNGGANNDILFGGIGADFLDGGNGNDTLEGGTGQDSLKGGAGEDVFVFANWREIGNGRLADVILDFNTSMDVIDLRQIDADETSIGNQSFTFIGSGRFSGTAGELNYVNGKLRGDVNGDSNPDFSLAVANFASIEADDLLV